MTWADVQAAPARQADTAPAIAADDADAACARISDLRREIARHEDLYFKKAAPEISDFEYDTLKRELRALEVRYPSSVDERTVASEIGDDRDGARPTWRHGAPMLSLDKAHSDEELATFHARVASRLGHDDVEYRVEPKYDGIAVSLTYERGRLTRATTRGNGTEGDDITAAALVVRGVAQALRASPAVGRPERVELRGEIFLSFSEFARVNEERAAAGEAEFANPRNLAAGSIRLKDTDEIATRGLEFVGHGWGAWEPAAERPATLGEFHAVLAAWGLPTVAEAKLARGAAELTAATNAMRDAGTANGFPTDGVVVKLERVADQDALGVGPSAPRWALARKFAPGRVATRLLGITWQVGRSGVLTPVAELEPVVLDGSTVARATLHNADEIARRDLRLGDLVFVEKAGEIVPAVVGVDRAARVAGSEVYSGPESCPACATSLVRVEEKTVRLCANHACPARLARQLEHLASADALDIAGLGPALIETLIAHRRVKSSPDLLRLSRRELRGLPGVGEKSAESVMAELEAARLRAQTDGARLIYALGWPGVGRESARRLGNTFNSLEAVAAADESTLRLGAGLGAATARTLAIYLASAEGLAERAAWAELGIGKTWNQTKRAGPLAGESVVVTGALTRWTRAQVTARLMAAGADVVGDVTRRTTLLVAGAEPGEKLNKARARGVTVIDEAELARRLGEP